MQPLASDLDEILAATRDLWSELRGKSLFLTGGTGFFGCWLLESFLWANQKLALQAQVTVLTRNPQDFRTKVPHLALNKSVTLLEGDLRTFQFPAGTYPYLIHAAAEITPSQEDFSTLTEIGVQGTERVLHFASQAGTQKLLFISSGAVYGPQPPNLARLPEDYPGQPDPFEPASAYGRAKRAAEKLCIAATDQFPGLAIKIARCFTFVGPYLPLNQHYAIGNFILDGLNGRPIMVKSDGTACRSYLDTADLALWLWTILFKGQSNHPYNVGSDQEHNLSQIAGLVAAQFPTPPQVQIQTRSPGQPSGQRYIPEIKRAATELGLVPRTPLPAAIRKTIRFYQSR